jgi:hypothetical protein
MDIFVEGRVMAKGANPCRMPVKGRIYGHHKKKRLER